MALQFRILPGSPLPIYRQVFDQVRMAIARGDFAEGEQLPSVRALAELLLVNPNTIARAYAELTRDGLVDSQAGRGLFIAARRRVETSIQDFVAGSILHGLSKLSGLNRVLIRVITSRSLALNCSAIRSRRSRHRPPSSRLW